MMSPLHGLSAAIILAIAGRGLAYPSPQDPMISLGSSCGGEMSRGQNQNQVYPGRVVTFPGYYPHRSPIWYDPMHRARNRPFAKVYEPSIVYRTTGGKSARQSAGGQMYQNEPEILVSPDDPLIIMSPKCELANPNCCDPILLTGGNCPMG